MTQNPNLWASPRIVEALNRPGMSGDSGLTGAVHFLYAAPGWMAAIFSYSTGGSKPAELCRRRRL